MIEKSLDAVGKIEIQIGTKKSLGSACLIKNKGAPIIATAAHCLYDFEEDYFYEKISFRLFLERFKREYKAKYCIIPKIWKDVGALEYDIGFVVLEDEISKVHDCFSIGIEPTFSSRTNESYHIIGFSNSFLPAKKPTISSGIPEKDEKYNSSLLGLKSKGKNGMSGCPWIVTIDDMPKINAVTSLSFKSNRNMLWASPWDWEIKEIYEQLLNHSCKSDLGVMNYY